MSYKPHYSRFLSARPNWLHFAAHSHYYWLDATRDAVLECWDDAARFADEKWTHIFSAVIPEAQQHIARVLDLSQPEQIAFAPNTHEFVVRIFSCFESKRPVRILTTDAEFHSFTRQVARMKESGLATVTEVPAMPFDTFEERFKHAAGQGEYDLVFFSHVFYNSGYWVKDLAGIVGAVKSEKTIIVIDGYHSFCAVPFSLKDVEKWAFYLSGGYKYAQSGEGVCFLAVPPECKLRPVNTGWFAAFGNLSHTELGTVPYSDDGFRFWGATFEPTGFYRFNAVMRWLQTHSLDVSAINKYVRTLQQAFFEKLETTHLPYLKKDALILPFHPERHGHFLTFRLLHAADLQRALLDLEIYTDVRADRLRFGFGLYHDAEDIEEFLRRLHRLDIAG